MAILSRALASLTRQLQPEGPTPKIWPSEAQSAIAPHKQFINGRPQSSIEAGPDGKFIKASLQWPLYQGL